MVDGGGLTGLKKAAVLAVILGPEKAAAAIARSELDEAEVERLAAEVARMQTVDPATRERVADECRQLLSSAETGAAGIEIAYDLLHRALGQKKADQVIARLRQRWPERPFGGLAQMEAAALVELLRDESPRGVAVVLGRLPRKVAGEVLSGLPEDLRMEAVIHLAKGGDPFTETLRQMESALGRKAASLGGHLSGREPEATTSGPRAVVETLNHADLNVETAVLEALAQRAPDLGEQVRESMFIFEDLPHLDPRGLQTMLRQVEPSDLALALKGAPDEIRAAITENLSENAAAGLREDLESLGPVRRRDVAEAQQKIIMKVRELADEGKIQLRQDSEEEVIA